MVNPKRLQYRLFLLFVTVLAVLTVACGADEEVAEPLRPVRVMKVTLGEGFDKRRLAGVAKSSTEANLSFRVQGGIDKLNVEVGDSVKKGDLIASLDAADFHIEAQEAAASLGQAIAQERNAAANYRRIQALYENDNASKQDLDVAKAEAETARMQVSSAKQRVQLARRQLGYTRLTAPSAGQISDVPVEQNENVAAGQTIAVLHSEGEIEVSVAVPESFISAIHQGDRATVYFDALDGKSFDARATEVGVSAAGATAFPVTLRLDASSEDLRSGMAAEVEFRFDRKLERSAVPTVPSSAVGEDRKGRFLYVAKPKGSGLATVERREVELGKVTSQGIDVVKGIKEGDLVVTAGVTLIQDGLEVRLLEDTKPPDPADGAEPPRKDGGK